MIGQSTSANLFPLPRLRVMFIGGFSCPEPGGCVNTGFGQPFGSLRDRTEVIEVTIAEVTTAGAAVRRRTAGEAVHDLRRLTGLTWDQLAKIFDVSRRTLHLWASGRPMTGANEAKLHRVLAFVHKVDRGAARENRALLLSVRIDGVPVTELLRLGRYSEADAVGRGTPRRRPPMGELSSEARRARQPDQFLELLEARQDAVQKKEGRLVRELSRPLKRPK